MLSRIAVIMFDVTSMRESVVTMGVQMRYLMFGTTTAPEQFIGDAVTWREELNAEYARADEGRRSKIAKTACEGVIDLCSALPFWGLQANKINKEKESDDIWVTNEFLEDEAKHLLGMLGGWGCSDMVKLATAGVMALDASNLLKLTRMTLFGNCNTYWGNDYAANLRQAMRKGAAMATTNPVLINIARTEAPEIWTPVRDKLRADHPDYGPVDLAYAMTIQVVVSNAKLLRPIWELTDGAMGYVSLQLSPKNSADADQMAKEAKWVWSQLEEGLGGTPNCVFKLPGTKAGIEVAEDLTASGMGVNITVNYSLPQQIAFAGAIERNSTTKVCYRTQMDGRVDDPIGDELKAAGLTDWEEVKKWATTAIRQREYRLLCFEPTRGGLGMKKSIPLPASGRGPWNILRSVHSEPEVPIFLTIFPSQQELFDAESREIDPHGMWTPLPEGYLDKLNKSRIFRQAYEPDGMRVEEFDSYPPVVATLTQFAAAYDEFVAWVTATG